MGSSTAAVVPLVGGPFSVNQGKWWRRAGYLCFSASASHVKSRTQKCCLLELGEQKQGDRCFSYYFCSETATAIAACHHPWGPQTQMHSRTAVFKLSVWFPLGREAGIRSSCFLFKISRATQSCLSYCINHIAQKKTNPKLKTVSMCPSQLYWRGFWVLQPRAINRTDCRYWLRSSALFLIASVTPLPSRPVWELHNIATVPRAARWIKTDC